MGSLPRTANCVVPGRALSSPLTCTQRTENNVVGTADNDTLNQASDAGPGTISGLAGNDSIRSGTGIVSITGDSGNDTISLQTGNIVR